MSLLCTHFQCLLMLFNSPLNRAGLLQVYVRTEKNVLIEINPQTRIPRTFKRFSGLMGKFSYITSVFQRTMKSQKAPVSFGERLLGEEGALFVCRQFWMVVKEPLTTNNAHLCLWASLNMHAFTTFTEPEWIMGWTLVLRQREKHFSNVLTICDRSEYNL